MIVLLVLVNLLLILKLARPDGILHIDDYTNKDIYRMVYMTPLEELPKRKRVVLKVETQKWGQPWYDIYGEDEL